MNHLKDLRIKNGLRQSDLAMEAGCSRSAVMRMEQFCYPTPLPNVIKALSDITGESEPELTKYYMNDLSVHRYFSGEHWLLAEYDPDHIVQLGTITRSKYGELFKVWRTYLAERAGEPTSQIHFCSSFGIHPAVLSKYETGATNHVPKAVVEALSVAGLDPSVCQYLAHATSFNGAVDSSD